MERQAYQDLAVRLDYEAKLALQELQVREASQDYLERLDNKVLRVTEEALAQQDHRVNVESLDHQDSQAHLVRPV